MNVGTLPARASGQHAFSAPELLEARHTFLRGLRRRKSPARHSHVGRPVRDLRWLRRNMEGEPDHQRLRPCHGLHHGHIHSAGMGEAPAVEGTAARGAYLLNNSGAA